MLKIKQYVKAESLEQAYELNQKKTNALADNEYCADPDCDRSVRTRTGSD